VNASAASDECPIVYTRYRDPAVAADGFTYERSAIERWIQGELALSSRPVCPPMTNLPMGDTRAGSRCIVLNHTLRARLREGVARGAA